MAKKPLTKEDAELFRALLKKARSRERLRMLAAGQLLIVDRRLFTEVGPPFRVPSFELFVAEEAFCVRDDAVPCISHIGDNFRKHFLPVVERGVPHDYLQRRRLRKRTTGSRMMPHLGGEQGAVCPLAHLYSLMVRANRGKDDYLMFCRTHRGAVWAITADQSPNGWWLEAANPVSEQRLFDSGRVVVSPEFELLLP